MKQMCCAISAMCETHGRVEGIAPLADVLDQDYGDAYRRVMALEHLRVLRAVRRGRGRRTLIYTF
jgi:hypothetical protein